MATLYNQMPHTFWWALAGFPAIGCAIGLIAVTTQTNSHAVPAL